MRGAFSLKSLAAAFLLVMTALVVPTGNASAHQGHRASPAPIHEQAAHQATADEQSVEQASHEGGVAAFVSADLRRDRGHCSDEGTAAHVGGCCTVACHAALGTPAASVDPCREAPSLTDGHPDQVLAGLSGGRNERPPRLG